MKKVHIEFRRVQTWLFAVPRLRAMVGANTLLGEFLRNRLPELARRGDAWTLAPQTGDYPPADRHDPLSEHQISKYHDDPLRDAQDGFISRDGGHFEACFSAGEWEFARAATAALRRDLPGLHCQISVGDHKETRLTAEISAGDHEEARPTAEISEELPVFAPCSWTGRGLASATVRQGSEFPEVTQEAAARHRAARRAASRQATDLATLLAGCTNLKDLKMPEDFEDLARRGYLALIHADGNGVGAAIPRLDRPEAERAAFHHRNRVLLRRAARFAIDSVTTDAGKAPLVPLMLGGDDLLVVCRAGMALLFVVRLCEELERIQEDQSSHFHLTLGIGVVFAKPTVPFHRLHEVAENLASSAKRRFRGYQKDEQVSVADWAVYTTAWVDDPAWMRRRDWVRGVGEDMRVLSLRPMPVLGNDLACVSGLVSAAKALKEAPRSQLRFLVDQLPRGKALSELAFQELSPKTHEALQQVGVSKVWNGGTPLSTSLLDLVEVFEIQQLGKKQQEEKTHA